MNKMLLVLRQEVLVVVMRPSFLITLIGLPVLSFLIFSFFSRMNQGQPGTEIVTQIMTETGGVQTEGYVDLAGIIQALPEGTTEELLVAYPNEIAAQQALDEGTISGYYLVPADYLQSGQVIYNRPDFNPINAQGQSDSFEWVLRLNLLGGDSQLASLTYGPLDLEKVSLAIEPERDQANMLSFWLPYGVTILFYIILMGSASLLLSSVAKEKENRILEILMVSVTPHQLLTGKIIALGMVGLLQTVVWVVIGRALLTAGEQTFNLGAAFRLPPSFLYWAVVFFLLGYALYASLMAGLGALVPNLREASQATLIVVFPLIIPLFLISIMIEQPNGPLAVILSLVPFTAPVVMMLRLSATSVPLWQTILSALLLLVTAVLVLRSVARMFRAQSLLSGQAFSVKLYLRALAGKGI
jgi:ABC-2 type transport system permease protein